MYGDDIFEQKFLQCNSMQIKNSPVENRFKFEEISNKNRDTNGSQ